MTPPGMAGGVAPSPGRKVCILTRLSELYPRTAEKFGNSLSALTRLESEWLEHGWSASVYVFAYSDDLSVRAASWRDAGNLFLSYRFSVLLYMFRAEYAAMAGRKPKESRAQRAKWIGFLDYRLTEDELSGLDEWMPTTAEIWERVDALIEGGYRLALSYNTQFKVATCTIMDDDGKRKCGGYGLSSSDADGAMALKAALYKHFEVLLGSWDSLLDAPLTTGRRG